MDDQFPGKVPVAKQDFGQVARIHPHLVGHELVREEAVLLLGTGIEVRQRLPVVWIFADDRYHCASSAMRYGKMTMDGAFLVRIVRF
jgi:hypothetical protein